VAELQQAERGDQREQRAVGHRACVVHRVGLAAEGQRHRLRGLGAREVEGGVPDERHRRRQQQRERQPRGQRGVERRREQRDEGGAQPMRQQCRVAGHEAQRRCPPRGAALGDGHHLAERCEVGVAPRVAPHQTGQQVGAAQQPQRRPRQAARARTGDEGRARPQVHRAIIGERPRLRNGRKTKGSRSCLVLACGATLAPGFTS
jgi:hypothetical protein